MEKSLCDKKARLREEYRKLRSSIGEADRRHWDEVITRRVLSVPGVVSAGVVFVYLSRSGEVSTTTIVDALLKLGKRVLTPSPDIRALPHDGLFKVSPRLDAGAAFVPAPCDESRIDRIDVILVPGIVWDKTGNRIGFGGGYFDRLLSMARPDCLKLGLAFELQMIEEVPREPWDERTDLVVTDSHIFDSQPI